jgi:hypothetical protein
MRGTRRNQWAGIDESTADGVRSFTPSLKAMDNHASSVCSFMPPGRFEHRQPCTRVRRRSQRQRMRPPGDSEAVPWARASRPR